jgi:hypothetical protein
MRVITNDAAISRNRRFAHLSFFGSAIALLAAFLFSYSGDPDTVFYIQCGVFPALFLMILFAVRMMNNWVREPLPWIGIQEAIRGISSKAVLYHFVFPSRHVLISPMGVYTFLPLFHDRHIQVKDDQWRMPGGLVSAALSVMRQERIGNPTRDAKIEAQFFQRILDKYFPDNDIEVQPIIVFLSPNVQVDIEGEQSVPITFASDNHEPALKSYLRSQRDGDYATLTEEQIDELDERVIYVVSNA